MLAQGDPVRQTGDRVEQARSLDLALQVPFGLPPYQTFGAKNFVDLGGVGIAGRGPRALASATIAAAAACSGDSCRPSPSVFFRGLTTFDVITHSAHPASLSDRRVGPKTPLPAQSRKWRLPY
ncbi:hypothetical protein [Actinoplanes sp. NPDC051411]|uniref:hypothetical protein n=1 Tax=Actinoplanes sp. NPDC051411 TaxID=3155522 RepID=UPI00343B8612